MNRHFQRELRSLSKGLLQLCAVVELNLRRSVKSLGKKDTALASRLEDIDDRIDRMEIMVEEECLKILALHQPVAVDLRYVVTALKLTNELERIGDLALHIAARGSELSASDLRDFPHDIPNLAKGVQKMLRDVLKALLNFDAELARAVCQHDKEIDEAHKSMFGTVLNMIKKDATRAEQWIKFLSISRYLERIADHVTNIAEDIIYMIEGRIVRHRHEEAKSQ
jgi:phosphate transport system protein